MKQFRLSTMHKHKWTLHLAQSICVFLMQFSFLHLAKRVLSICGKCPMRSNRVDGSGRFSVFCRFLGLDPGSDDRGRLSDSFLLFSFSSGISLASPILPTSWKLIVSFITSRDVDAHGSLVESLSEAGGATIVFSFNENVVFFNFPVNERYPQNIVFR